jgi:hypothetical protein
MNIGRNDWERRRVDWKGMVGGINDWKDDETKTDWEYRLEYGRRV